MVKPAFLSAELYRRQSHELIVCTEITRGVKDVLRNSLAAAQQLGLARDVEMLESVVQLLLETSEMLDNVILLLTVTERISR